METYLETIHVNEFRVSLCKLRLSSHDLAIEKGRHNNINRENRLCRYCNMNVIENELHFLFVYPKYRHLSIKYFKPIFCESRFLHRPHWESNPGSLRDSPLHNRCATPAPLRG